jgi:hypothetical protein
VSLVAEAVTGGFRRSVSRLHLVAADMATKLVWLCLSLACILAAVMAFLAALQPPPGVPQDLAGLIVLARALRAWPVLAGGLLVAAGVSFAAWCVLEALIRSRIVGWVRPGVGFRAVFWRFLTSGLLRRGAFALTATLILVVLVGPALTGNSAEWTRTRLESPWAWVGGGLVLVMVAFALMLTDTLVRCDAIETLGGHVGTVVAVVSAVGLTEVGIRWGALMATLITVRILPSPLGLIVAVPTVGLVLSLAHSYLLVVRYSAVDIIRQHIESSGITPTGNAHHVPGILS